MGALVLANLCFLFFFKPQMEGVPPSCNEDDVNLTSNQFDFQSPEDSFNISEFLSYVILKHILSEDDCLRFSYFSLSYILFHGSRPAPEVPVNQGSISCNDQGGQNNVINDSIQQTTQFPLSFRN